MKKLLLSLSLIVGSSAMLSAQTNLIENGDFEGLATLHQPKVGEGDGIYWKNDNPVAAPYVSGAFNYTPGDTQWRLKKPNTTYIKTDFYAGEGVDGSQALKFVVNQNVNSTAEFPWYNNTVYQAIGVDKTKAYEVTLWAKGNTSTLYVQFYTNYTGTTAKAIAGQPSQAFSSETEEWAQYTFTLDIAAADNSLITDDAVYTNKTVFALGLKTTIQQMKDSGTAVFVDDVKVYEKSMVGIENNNKKVEIPLYVNNGTVYFKIEEAYKVTLYDIVGKAVVTKTIEPGQSLPVQAQGCFILKLENAKGAIQTQKVVIK